MEKIYNHKKTEENKMNFWNKNNFFTKRNYDKKPFSIIMPPPNVTGKLHIGHAWDCSLQDLLIRYKKISDYDVLYVPGMDHAGIATQAKFENILWKEEKKTRYDLGKKKLISNISRFSNINAKIIEEQWNKLGLAIDKNNQFFTFDKNINEIVNKVFVDLYNKKLIYQAKKIILWDIKQQTALSNIEVEHKTQKGKLYYFKYFLEDNSTFLPVATTRPETMFADQALVVNSKDVRFKKYISKNVINPINNKIIPIISDDYVSIEYGTGIMKCTPAHDLNDYNIGKKHNLKFEECIDKYGKLTSIVSEEYKDMDRFVARDKIIKELNDKNLIIKIEDIIHNVSYSQRTNTIVEPIISNQWFISMSKFSEKIIKMQKSNDKICFFPENFNNNLLSWMNNLDDWCISRQIWWGHQIPVWYNNNNDIYVSEKPPKDIENWKQDEDVLDTWFSSSLLPFVALGWNFNQKIFDRFFSSDVLVTGYDIIFFWVSRMIFQTSNLLNTKAFKNVLIHGLIRDSKGLKMSKSLGNGIDPMDIIENYGTDSLRFFLLTNSSPGKDLRYNEEKIKYAWNFINKIWNASRFVIQNIPENYKFNFENIFNNINNKINIWIINNFLSLQKNWFKNMEKFEFAIAANELVSFFWDKYCSWYIEFSKIIIKEDLDETINILVFILVESLKMLHPYIPFVTEDIYQKINIKSSILLERYQIYQLKNQIEDDEVDTIINIINKIREFRSSENINNKNIKLNINLITKNKQINLNINNINIFIEKIINTNLISINDNFNKNEKNILISFNDFIIEIINNNDLNKLINFNYEKELEKLNKEILRSEKILENSDFIKKAKSDKVKIEKDKLNNYKKAKRIILSKISN